MTQQAHQLVHDQRPKLIDAARGNPSGTLVQEISVLAPDESTSQPADTVIMRQGWCCCGRAGAEQHLLQPQCPRAFPGANFSSPKRTEHGSCIRVDARLSDDTLISLRQADVADYPASDDPIVVAGRCDPYGTLPDRFEPIDL